MYILASNLRALSRTCSTADGVTGLVLKVRVLYVQSVPSIVGERISSQRIRMAVQLQVILSSLNFSRCSRIRCWQTGPSRCPCLPGYLVAGDSQQDSLGRENLEDCEPVMLPTQRGAGFREWRSRLTLPMPAKHLLGAGLPNNVVLTCSGFLILLL